MVSLIKNDGTTANTPMEILAKATDYYNKLFKLEETTPDIDILDLAPKLSQADSANIDFPITRDEINEAISALGHHKAPVFDGLTSEFYKRFKNLISPILFLYFTAFQGQMSLPDRLEKVCSGWNSKGQLFPEREDFDSFDQNQSSKHVD